MRVAGIAVASGVAWEAPTELYLRPLAGEPLLLWSIRALATQADRVVAIVPPPLLTPATLTVRAAGLAAIVVAAERERWHSMRIAVAALGPSDLVVVHDVFRPLAAHKLFARVLTEASSSGAAACALPLEGSIAEVDHQKRAVRMPLPQALRLLQSPQAFVTGLLQDSLEAVAASISSMAAPPADDAAAVQYAGGLVQVVDGDPDNRPIVDADDFAWAEAHAARLKAARA